MNTVCAKTHRVILVAMASMLVITAAIFAQPATNSMPQIDALQMQAKTGDVSAQYALGMAYFSGTGIAQNYMTALRWFRKAAEQGNADAQIRMGMAYVGLGPFKRDPAVALNWFRQAADQNNPLAQCLVGEVYYCFLVTNKAMALPWYRKAAAQGFPSAEYQLATMYDRGIAVPTNHAEALGLYRKSALHGFVTAFRQMAWQYAHGIGTETNNVEACAWIKLYRSRRPDNEDGMNFENVMRHKMTPEQLAKADERTAELKAEVPPTEPAFMGLMSLLGY